jgi:CYTH domain-containing protein
MGTEIERKFLVTGDGWRANASAASCRQGYLAVGPPVAVRVRIMGGKATLNVKKATLDIVRDEFEYEIPGRDAEEILNNLCEGCIIEKTRYRIEFGGKKWEIDEFSGANSGLVVAEIELDSPGEAFLEPPWLGAEVSGDARYLNSTLSRRPYSLWEKDR